MNLFQTLFFEGSISSVLFSGWLQKFCTELGVSPYVLSLSSYEKGFGGEQGNQNPALGSRGILDDVDKAALKTTEQGAGYRNTGFPHLSQFTYSPCG